MQARPLPIALGFGVIAQALFCWRLTTPHRLMFDEVHYVPAARQLLALASPANPEHPLVGKLLIALGIMLFGDGPLGWRVASSIAGTSVVLGIFWILWLTFRRMRPAVTGAVLTLLNFAVFVQARIAMLDGIMAAFVVLGTATLLWSMRGHGPQVWRRWLGGSALLGLAVGTKWTAVPYVAYAAVAFVVLKRSDPTRWSGLGWPRAIAILGIGSVATYFATFVPAFFYADRPLTFATLLPFQVEMLRQQTQVLPAHTYQSAWWTWPLLVRPIWYFYEVADGAQRGVLMLGNPAVMWGGLIAVAACLYARTARLAAIAALWVGSYAVWAVIPKSLGFYYYYYLPSIWLPVAIAAAFEHWRRRLAGWDGAFLAASTVLFVWFHPILSAAPLSGPQAFVRWTWFDGWR